VLPYLRDLWIDAEDSLSLETGGPALAARGRLDGVRPLTVTVVQLPRVSNFTDVDALRLEPGVEVAFSTTPRGIAEADLVVLPGTKSTVEDLAWMDARGICAALLARHAAGGAILGVCGGYQMLGREIEDEVESGRGRVEGLGLLPVRTRFAAGKTLARPRGFGLGAPVETAYEIHHGLVEVLGGVPLFTDAHGAALDGCVLDDGPDGAVLGTLWHGALESDAFRAALLDRVAATRGLPPRPRSGVRFADARAAQFDRLADAVDEYADTAALLRLIEQGPTPGLPALPPGRDR
jgi:adenosylcobyric acid synthase